MTWPTATVGDVCLATTQADPMRLGRPTFRYVDISSVDRDAKAITNVDESSVDDAPSRARKLIEASDILVSTVRPNLNAIAFVPQELDGEIASTGFCVLRANKKLANAKFLYYWAQHSNFVEFLVANATGASYPAVSDAIVKRAPLPLPPLSEQRRIVELLGQADALRRLRREADAKAARILPALFLKMFGDPATNPMGFPKKPLGELFKVRSGDFLPAKDMAPDGTFPVYGGNGINGHHDSFMFDDRKIILGRVGAYCGAVHYSQPNSWITDNALYVSEKSELVEDHYLIAALEQANLNQYAGRAGQPLISGSRIYPVSILVPPENLQRRFSISVENVRALENVRSSASARLDHLWESLMSRAFTGELTTKWRQVHKQELLVEMQQQAKAMNLPVPKEIAA